MSFALSKPVLCFCRAFASNIYIVYFNLNVLFLVLNILLKYKYTFITTLTMASGSCTFLYFSLSVTMVAVKSFLSFLYHYYNYYYIMFLCRQIKPFESRNTCSFYHVGCPEMFVGPGRCRRFSCTVVLPRLS